nr:hypothetical protein [uncultured Pedobacter sp.]
MSRVALIIIYNHQHNTNIDVIESIFKGRFSTIYHLVPFYSGDKKNVISVFGNSFFFQGYVAQGLKSYFDEVYDHYFFIADDLLLNPIINERNYTDIFNLDKEACFVSDFITLHDRKEWWGRVGEAFRWNIKVPGIQAQSQLPSYDVAIKKFEKFNLDIKSLSFDQIYRKPKSLRDYYDLIFKDQSYILKYLSNLIAPKKYNLSYPMVGSYSDIFIVNNKTIKEFCQYCGVFASTSLFVEVALPTAIVLSADKIVTETDLNRQGKAMWTPEDYREIAKYSYSYQKLVNEFPHNYLYLHPIKLSKWKI